MISGSAAVERWCSRLKGQCQRGWWTTVCYCVITSHPFYSDAGTRSEVLMSARKLGSCGRDNNASQKMLLLLIKIITHCAKLSRLVTGVTQIT